MTRTRIANAGLVVGTVTRVVNSTAPGTVVDQNASAGTVAPIGSPVNLTVSLGVATVPNARSLVEGSAADTIAGLGLLGAPLYSNDCLSPGRVTMQNPAPNTRVAPGSIVTYTASTCNVPGGGGGDPQPV